MSKSLTNPRIADLLAELDSSKRDADRVHAKLQLEYNKVFDDSKALAAAIANAGINPALFKCGAVLRAHWISDGLCNGCRNPHLIVKSKPAKLTTG